MGGAKEKGEGGGGIAKGDRWAMAKVLGWRCWKEEEGGEGGVQTGMCIAGTHTHTPRRDRAFDHSTMCVERESSEHAFWRFMRREGY